MRVCIYSDPHWSQNSSIVRSRGTNYSTRLENLINSINWVEMLAWNNACDCVICCGDFFDSYVLNAEEVSALQEIRWAPISHLFLTGNHETNVSSLEYSTTDLFKLCPNSAVMNTPQQYMIEGTNTEFCFLPYVLERDRKTLEEYFGSPKTRRVIFSHNDLKDVQYGAFLSTEGVELSNIDNNCDLYFNGHIHHCCNVNDKVINIGNLTGQNFTEDATKYTHCAIILDVDSLSYQFYENPFALQFYKIDCSTCSTFEDVRKNVSYLKDNSVVTLTVPEEMSCNTRALLESLKGTKLQEFRLLVHRKQTIANAEDIADSNSSSDHLSQFQEYVLANIGATDIIRDELQHIMG